MSDLGSWLFGLLAFIPGLGGAPAPVYSGYVEADYIYVAPAGSGQIIELAVHQGQHVAKGELLFALASVQQAQALKAAEARIAAAEANLRNLESGSRQAEVDVVRASLAKAEADRTLAEQNLERVTQLFAEGLVPKAQADQVRAGFASAEAQVAQLKAQLAVAELPARNQQQIAAQASLDAARADAEKARADLADRRLLSPADGLVDRLYFDAGEMAGTAMPVAALRPDGALKVKFFVPETVRARLTPGMVIDVACDGCADGLTASLTELSSEPEFTAPIIFSREERGRLVYRAEAQLPEAATLLPGQPVSVTLP